MQCGMHTGTFRHVTHRLLVCQAHTLPGPIACSLGHTCQDPSQTGLHHLPESDIHFPLSCICQTHLGMGLSTHKLGSPELHKRSQASPSAPQTKLTWNLVCLEPFLLEPDILEMSSRVQLNHVPVSTAFSVRHVKRKKSDSRMDQHDRRQARAARHFLRDHMLR